mgnify:CR=1 FL=1
MRSSVSSFWVVRSIAVLALANIHAAETPGGRGARTISGSPAPQRSSRSSASRALLPDPALLDGAAQPADKQSENGMLGEFELPGDDDVRNGTVGGPEKASEQKSNDSSMPQNGGSPQGTRAEGPAGGGGLPGGPDIPPGEKGSAAGGGSSDQQAGQIPGGDPNGAAEGIQVAELQGDPQDGANPGGSSQKPPPVAIGDSAMQIQGIQNAPTVVGGQVAAKTQQMEKAVGGGAKGEWIQRQSWSRKRPRDAGGTLT